MSILINKNTSVLISGITGKEGTFHTERMIEYGTKVVAGVTPGKGGIIHCGVSVYNSVSDATKNHKIDACGVFVPDAAAMNAVSETIQSGIKLIIIITEGISPHTTMRFISIAKKNGVTVLGPNTPGVVTPGESSIGVFATDYLKKGRTGVISRSGTLTVEICYYLQKEGFGQSTVVGIGGDPVVGTTFKDIYKMFENDPATDSVVIVGEVGGTLEEELAEYVQTSGK
ncbi:MAG: CoA-binding protein, partial [Elusimicrobiota bacterium]